MKKLKITILLLYCFITIQAQQQTVVIMHYYTNNYFKDSFLIDILKPVSLKGSFVDNYESKLLSYSKNGNRSTSISSYKILDTTLATIFHGFGHETIIVPGDTIEFEVDTLPSPKIQGIYPTGWINNFHFRGSKKHIYALLDSVNYVVGDLRFSTPSYKKAANLDSFYSTATNIYNARISYLNEYCKRNLIAPTIEKLVETEIKSAYFRDLLSPCGKSGYPKSMFPAYYIKVLNNYKPDTSMFLKTKFSLQQQNSKIEYEYFQEYLTEIFTNTGFVGIYKKIFFENKFNSRIKELLLLDYLSYMTPVPYPLASFDSVISQLAKTTSYSSYIKDIQTRRNKVNASMQEKINFSDVLATNLLMKNGQVKQLSSLFKEKLVLIDIWASWCVPCIQKMPILEKVEEKFKKDVDVYYLSFDRNISLWKQKSSLLKVKGEQLLLPNHFESSFAKYFKIDALPRYLLFDKKGNYSPFTSLPSSIEDFYNKIESIIEKK